MRFEENSTIGTANGASGVASLRGSRLDAENENPGTKDPDPKCSETGIRASSQARQSGSQWSVWKDGCPSGTGLSGKLTVLVPLAASRRTSATERSTSQTGRIAIGMK